MFMKLIEILSWFAVPVGAICILDDWIFRPRRYAAATTQPVRDPPLMAFLYSALPVLIGAAVLRLLTAERLDFSVVLVGIVIVTGFVWWFDFALLRHHRAAVARAAGKEPHIIPEPGTVDYARSFFPVALVVLLLRAFIFEPFRIPSDSMMPTLLTGDFIVVNKYAYGLRLPVLNRKVVQIGEPQRGDVVVFRYPRDPSMNYIKRLVGVPGDHIEVREDRLYVNGQPVPFKIVGDYNDGCYLNLKLAEENLNGHVHKVMSCPTGLMVPSEPPAGCNRSKMHGYVCGGDGSFAGFFGAQPPYVKDVPAGMYLMVGDNRDNSSDGREWGFVAEDHLVGKATRIWFNWSWQRSGGPMWGRIGLKIE